MSKVFGTNEKLIIESDKDSDGELEVSMAVMAYDADREHVDTWLTRDDAIRLMTHLQTVFGI